MSFITRLVRAIRRQADAPVDDTPTLNRRQRRDLDKMKPGELQMRRQRTYLAQQKRKRHNGAERGDHGAKARRAYRAGVDEGTKFTRTKVLQAYSLGITKGREQTAARLWFSPRFWLSRKKAAA